MLALNVVTPEGWLVARKELLAREKEFDYERDRLTEARRKLPMVKVQKEYVSRQNYLSKHTLWKE